EGLPSVVALAREGVTSASHSARARVLPRPSALVEERQVPDAEGEQQAGTADHAPERHLTGRCHMDLAPRIVSMAPFVYAVGGPGDAHPSATPRECSWRVACVPAMHRKEFLMLIAGRLPFALFTGLISLAIGCGSPSSDESTTTQNGALSTARKSEAPRCSA